MPSGQATQAIAGTSEQVQLPVNSARVGKFTLPDFTPNDPETWFAAVEHIFLVNNITSDDVKFANLLQYLDGSELCHIKDIISSTETGKYGKSKSRLIQIHGKSQLEQLTKLLKGVDTDYQMKPSVVLTKMRNLVGPEASGTELLRSIWLQKLPPRTCEILAIDNSKSLEQQAQMADRLYETYESNYYNSTRNNTVAATTSANSDLTALVNLIKNLQVEIAEIKTEQKISNQNRSRPFYRNRSRSRGSRSVSEGRTQFYGELCWYHHNFGTNARKCAPGCSQNQNSEN